MAAANGHGQAGSGAGGGKPETGRGDEVSRREFLVRLGIGGATATGILAVGGLLHRPAGSKPQGGSGAKAAKSFALDLRRWTGPEAVVVRGGSVADRVRKAIEKLGGMTAFVSKGDRVLLKPNMAWDRAPAYAANTNPEVVRVVASLCYAAGASVVYVADNPVNDGRRAARHSGIQAACQASGAKLVLPGEGDFVSARIGGKQLRTWPVMSLLYRVDKVIDLPVFKHHRLSRVTGALKNWIGIAGGRRMRLHQNIHQSIVDLVAAFPPTLVVCDAGLVLARNGPTGGRLSDVKKTDILVAGLRPGTVDTLLLPLLDLKPGQVGHVLEAAARGLGTLDESRVARVRL